MAFTQTKTFSINESSVALVDGDVLKFKLVLAGSSSANFSASLSEGSLYVASLAASTGYASTTCEYFHTSSISASSAAGTSSIITLSPGLSTFFNNNYQFVPNPLTGSQTSSLYTTYGDVDYPFYVRPYDIVISYLSDNTYVESRIISSSVSASLVRLHLDSDMATLYKNNLVDGNYKSFLILTRVNDETNAHAIFRKRDGKTSYGFVIPENIAPDVLANIDLITREVKQKLLADQQGTTS